jgi:uncharacterized membrane-anchored protein YitT (DUF2179 family)
VGEQRIGPADTETAPFGPPHSFVDDVFGMATGAVVVSFGVHLLSSVEAVTGGTAGLALLTSYGFDVAFGLVFAAINLPFFVLALAQKGWRFTIRSLLSVAIVSALSAVHPELLDLGDVDDVYAVLLGNLLVGIGLLILFRHGSSVGGFGIVALLAQERLGWRAGYVQMTFDVAVVLSALAVVDARMVLVSAIGAALLNLVLAINHRPGRYLGM